MTEHNSIDLVLPAEVLAAAEDLAHTLGVDVADVAVAGLRLLLHAGSNVLQGTTLVVYAAEPNPAESALDLRVTHLNPGTRVSRETDWSTLETYSLQVGDPRQRPAQPILRLLHGEQEVM
jgi:hypothetical protein